MAAKEDILELYDIVLSSPGIDANVKLDSRVSCRTALFLVIAIEFGMSSSDPKNPLKVILSDEDQEILKNFKEEILQRARLQNFYNKLLKKQA